ncbi:hypothetical protein EV586_104376 [Tumebacillus sp. BK434]|uniref:metallophosphoesterase family protein n=1 Tax=Tumebacillus sp. BK434 TaxID=2512169 RepID=UPI00104EB2C9|nr:metallophosphoesterase [Tumebacillus sp. BK434]TCP54754.1 hypothetical protein EV586_104376 [Tumebacillus sp. BK434]
MSGTYRVLILSDSHGRTDRIDEVIAQVQARLGGYDLLLHAGDHAEDVLDGKYPNAVTVCGNCDPYGSAAEEQALDLYGVPALLLHGHTVSVKTSPLQLVYKAAEQGVQLAVFGHTHTPVLFVEDGCVFLNPGSLSVPRGYTVCTYAVLELCAGEAGIQGRFSFYTLDGTPIPAFDMEHVFSIR